MRNAAGGVVSRGGLFVGTAGGRLLAIDAQTGTIAWDGTVATPKGATELERIADVTSLPYVDDNEACAVAYQGRVACFDVVARLADLVARHLEPGGHHRAMRIGCTRSTTRAPYRHSTAATARRSGSRTCCRSGASAARN